MDAALAAILEFEVLDGIGQIHPLSGQPGLFHKLAQEAAGGTDEGPALQVLLVTRLLTNQKEPGSSASLPEHGLEMAREREVEGRSSMSKQELLKALS